MAKAKKKESPVRFLPNANLWKVERLKPYVRNARTHSPEQIAQIQGSMVEFGFTNPILATGSGEVLAGHGRLEAAVGLGLTQVPVLVVDHLTETQRRAYILADNKIAMNAGWNEAMLGGEIQALINADFDFSLVGFTEKEIQPFLAAAEEEAGSGENNFDTMPEVPVKPRSRRGELFLCGEHRLLCGDSTSKADVARLMAGEGVDLLFTDPPYGVSAGGGRSQTVTKLNMKAIANDDLRGATLEKFILDALALAPLKPNASFYVCYDQKTQFEFTGALKQLGWQHRATIIWNKNVFGLSGKKGYRPKYELIAFGYLGETYNWFGGNDQADVWDIPRPQERPGNHPTPKPVQLVERALLNSSERGDAVLDLFGGSGSLLVAAEKCGRRSFTMELEPAYIDCMIERWQTITGQEAVREDGATWNSLGAKK